MNQISTMPVAPTDLTSLVPSALESGSGGAAEKVAKDFESVFVSMLLKTMRQSMSEDMFAGDSSDTFGGMFDSFMGKHIAENGSIGLAKMIQDAGVKQLAVGADAKALQALAGAVESKADRSQHSIKMEAYGNAVSTAN